MMAHRGPARPAYLRLSLSLTGVVAMAVPPTFEISITALSFLVPERAISRPSS
jgi:hypothetical protein